MSDLTGKLIKTVGDAQVYLMKDGKRCWIPNQATFDNFYDTWDNIVDVDDISLIPEGDALSVGALLARAGTAPEIYLVSNGLKRHITGQQASPRNLVLDKTVSVDPRIMELIPTGAPL